MIEDKSDYDDIFDEQYSHIDVSGAMPRDDEFDAMDGDALDNWLKREYVQRHPHAIKKSIQSAIQTDNLKLKRELARKLVKDA